MDQFKALVFAIRIGTPGISYGKIKGVGANAVFTMVQCRVSDHRSVWKRIWDVAGVIIFPSYNFVYMAPVFPTTA